MGSIKKDDEVIVISGKDKGVKGRILKVFTDRDRVIVEGVNRVIRHSAPTPQNPEGGRIEMEAPVHISNVMLFDNKAEKRTRTRVGQDKDGKKVRIAIKSGSVID